MEPASVSKPAPGPEPASASKPAPGQEKPAAEAEATAPEENLQLLDKLNEVAIDRIDTSEIAKVPVKVSPPPERVPKRRPVRRPTSQESRPDARRPSASPAPRRYPTLIRQLSSGRKVDIRRYLTEGKLTVFHFYLGSDPRSREYIEPLRQHARHTPNVQLFELDIGEFGSPVARQYHVGRVPTFICYEGRRLVARDPRRIVALMQERREAAQRR